MANFPLVLYGFCSPHATKSHWVAAVAVVAVSCRHSSDTDTVLAVLRHTTNGGLSPRCRCRKTRPTNLIARIA